VPNSVSEMASSAFQGLFPGAVGGACCVLVGHPWDLIKVRIQTAPVVAAVPVGAAAGIAKSSCTAASMPISQGRAYTLVQQSPPPSGTVSIIRSIALQDGFAGFYRGVFPPLASVVPAFAFTFLANDFAQSMIRRYWPSSHSPSGSPTSRLTIEQYCVAGGFTAIPAAVILAPSERVKCLLQVQQSGKGASGPKAEGKIMLDCIKSLYNTGGIRSLYKGTAATLMRDIPGNAAYFGSYELTRSWLAAQEGLDDAGQLSPVKTMFAGGMAGVFNWIIALPMDVVKTRYQTAPEGMYTSYGQVFQRLIKEEGVQGLYRGLTPAILRAFPANAACFLGVELTRKAISPRD
jgi:solute carrier family 25 carnitine/acylcarnitine transporter 20/29